MNLKSNIHIIIGLILIIPGAFMIVDGIMVMLGNEAVFFEVPDYRFEFIIGYALIILGGSQLDSNDK